MSGRTLFVITLLSALWLTNTARPSWGAGAFDGSWDVTLVCPRAPDGALPFTFELTGDVKDSVLHAEHGAPSRPGWLSLDGPIQPDGDAKLDANGLTGKSKYNIDQTTQGVPYHYIVTAHFDGSRGTGSWVTNRTCDFTFTRQ